MNNIRAIAAGEEQEPEMLFRPHIRNKAAFGLLLFLSMGTAGAAVYEVRRGALTAPAVLH